ncbi:MAG: guanylate kinase [Bacilli bacterium]
MIILTGPSASGKTAACLFLQKHYGIRKVITHTTRPIRIGEKNDVDYHFVSEDEFLRLKNEDYFIETVFYNGHYYGTSRDEVRVDKCMAVELNGAKTYRGLNDPNIVLFYMLAYEKTRHDRMAQRGDAPDKIASRLQEDKTAFAIDDKMRAMIDIFVDTEKMGIEKASDFIYKKYIEILKERKIDFKEALKKK